MWRCESTQDKMINKEHPMEKWVVRKAFEDMLLQV
jgi:asparagine synthase (glutamine-hydrolysing)